MTNTKANHATTKPTVNNCASCGECCKHYAALIMLEPDDVQRLKQRRPRVLEYVETFDNDFGDAWFNPLCRSEVRVCPFLRQGQRGYYCEIYEDRPIVCRAFPGKKAAEICRVPIEKINVLA